MNYISQAYLFHSIIKQTDVFTLIFQSIFFQIIGVTDVIRQECRMLQKDVFQTSKDSLEFSMSETTDSIKTMPITWCVLNTVAENKNKVSDTTKVTTAACLLLNSRSKFMSKLQHNVVVSLYNNHLQKEGFEVLHHPVSSILLPVFRVKFQEPH